MPLVVGQKVVGSLNLYGVDRDAFDEQAQELAQLVAAHGGSATLATSVPFDARELAVNLRLALVSRSSIDRAVGIVMAQEGLDENQAFDLLVRSSQHANVKLRELATDLVHKVGLASRGDRD